MKTEREKEYFFLLLPISHLAPQEEQEQTALTGMSGRCSCIVVQVETMLL